MKRLFVIVLSAAACLFMHTAFALDLQQLKVHFLKGDYKAAITEGERVLAQANKHSRNLDELYYYLGICYMKEGNLLRAADIFDIILKEFPRSAFTEQTRIALIDHDLTRADWKRAQAAAEAFLAEYPRSKFRQEVQERLKRCRERPAAAQPEAATSRLKADDEGRGYYVQVGAFSSRANASKLAERLEAKGYAVVIAESESAGKSLFKVRVAGYKTRAQAEQVEAVLKQQGFPTKVLP